MRSLSVRLSCESLRACARQYSLASSMGIDSMGWSDTFPERVDSRQLTITVVGMGYVGLPTALGFLEAGFKVRGIDVSQRVIDALSQGLNPGDDPQHDDLIPSEQDEQWKVSTDYSEFIEESDVVLVTVPTPVNEDRTPDLTYVMSAGRSIFENIKRGESTVVVLESTVYPGVTREVWVPIMNQIGITQPDDVFLAYCPERFVPGDPDHGVRQVARVVGSTDEEVGKGLASLYRTLTEGSVTYVGQIEVAEAAKVVENVQRDLNIALVNELARIFPTIGIDVEEVLDAAATKWNFHRYRPGVGVGGHCIPVDPYYLIQKAHDAGAPVELITSARRVNSAMPDNVAQDLAQIFSSRGESINGARILLLGWSYKPGIGDARETPAEPLAKAFTKLGCTVQAFDPLVDSTHFPSQSYGLAQDIASIDPFDAAVLVTAHAEVLALDWEKLAYLANNRIMYDGRRVLDESLIEAAGWDLFRLGAPL